MNNEQKLARNGGQALGKAINFVTNCRTLDPLGNYLHIGDLQWWCREGLLDDQQNWHFWYQENGEVLALGILYGDEIACQLHPSFRTHEHYLTVYQWALQRLKERVRQQGENQFEVQQEIAADDPETIRFLEREGYTRQEKYYHLYHHSLLESVSVPVLPDGFTIRPVAGVAEAQMRAALHRDAFSPKGSKSYEEGTLRQLAIMQMPHYDLQLDLMVMAPDGTPAAGCICWVDPMNRVGLFEPVGTHPRFRRQGLATALVLDGLQRLRERGMQTALVLGFHPGNEADNTEFTSARFVYEAAGFQLQRRTYIYHRDFVITD